VIPTVMNLSFVAGARPRLDQAAPVILSSLARTRQGPKGRAKQVRPPLPPCSSLFLSVACDL